MSKILLVEDNPLSQKMMFYTFKHYGVTSDFAVDGQDAVDKAKAESYDIILMDILMPVFDGYQATLLIRKDEEVSGHKSFIVGLTSNVYDGERDKCLAAGMDEFLAKPFDIDKLKHLLEQHNIQLN